MAYALLFVLIILIGRVFGRRDLVVHDKLCVCPANAVVFAWETLAAESVLEGKYAEKVG
jgi:hypothetical protein